VRLQQVIFALSFPAVETVIGGQSVLYLLYLARRVALQNRGDLRLTQGVALNGQRAMDGADAVDAPQSQGSGLIGEHGQPPDGLADGGDPVQDLRSNGVAWLVGAYGLPSLAVNNADAKAVQAARGSASVP
jgi:hypothetical protein